MKIWGALRGIIYIYIYYKFFISPYYMSMTFMWKCGNVEKGLANNEKKCTIFAKKVVFFH